MRSRRETPALSPRMEISMGGMLTVLNIPVQIQLCTGWVVAERVVARRERRGHFAYWLP